MSLSFNAFDHKDWSAYGLSDNPCEFAEYVNQSEYGDGQLEGEWYDIPEEPLSVEGQGTFRVIYYGSFGNDWAPGASSFTWAELYDVTDPDEMADYAKAVERWENSPEYEETEDGWEDAEDEPEGDEEDGEEVISG
jgi:hypothetical protein